MEKITKEIISSGTIVYTNEDGKYHNINDKPAIIYTYGTEMWYKNGKQHRTKGPSVICIDGREFWWYEDNHITDKINQLMKEGRLNPDWRNWTDEDEFLFILLVS